MTPESANYKVNIPVELITYIFEHKLVNQFKIFVTSKMVTPGQFTANDSKFKALCLAANLKPRTVLKHLKHLTALGWINHDKANNKYYVRSWAWFRLQKTFTLRSSVCVKISDLNNFQALIAIALITQKIDNQKYYNQKRYKETHKNHRSASRKSRKSAVNKGDTASQDPSISSGLPYFGYSNGAIAKMLYISQTRACEIKQQAEAAGYISTNPRFKLIREFTEKIPNLKQFCQRAFGDDASKIRISTETRKGIKYYQLLLQLHTEIKPLIKLRRINYLKILKSRQYRSISPIFTHKLAS